MKEVCLALGRAPPLSTVPHTALTYISAGCGVHAWSSLCSFLFPQSPNSLIQGPAPAEAHLPPLGLPHTDEPR